MFLPQGYEPRYQYPLLVMLHGYGQRESQWTNNIQTISRRNYVCLALRGPQTAITAAGKRGFSWGENDPHSDTVENYLHAAIDDVSSRVSINHRRIYLAGIGEGAAMAYRYGFCRPFRFSRIIALNGWLPSGRIPPVFGMRRLAVTAQPKVLIGHGIKNTEASLSKAQEAHRLLYASGWDVEFLQYPCGAEICREMLRDIDRWLMDWRPTR
jgi:phospholipase/carboxylesterase